MFFTIVIIVFMVLFIKFVPIKRQVLGEGIFKEERRDYDLIRDEAFKSFIFEDFCKSCVEEWRETGKMPPISTLGPNCYVGIHTYSLNIGSVKPKTGDAVKVIGWQTVFGRVRLYYFQKSDFVWDDLYKEKDRQGAKKRGFSDVEEYKKIREQEYREKCIAELMKEENLTHDEAEIFEVFGYFEIRDREAKRLDKSIVELDEALHKNLREPDYCTKINGYYLAERYIEARSLDPEVRAHLNKCSSCNVSFMVALHGSTDEDREKIDAELNLRSCIEIDAEELGITVDELQERRNKNMTLRWGHGEDCYTMKERIAWARYEDLSAERWAHTESCLGCQRMIKADREDFVQTGRIGTLKMKEWRKSKSKNEAV